MSSESDLAITELIHDDMVAEERKKCKNPSIVFGGVAVGPNKVILCNKYKILCQRILDLEVRPDDVWIISHPRSGTTWTQELVWLLSNNLDYKTAKSVELYRRYRQVEFEMVTDNGEVLENKGGIDSLIASKSPRFIKTHLPFELLPKQLWIVKPKMIFIYRNPKDVVLSQYPFYKMVAKYTGDFEDFAEIFLLNKCIYGPFWNHVLDLWKVRQKFNIKFLIYEEMKQNLQYVIHQLAEYLGVNITADQSLELSAHLDVKNMRENDAVNHKKLFMASKVISRPEDSVYIRVGTLEQWKTMMSPELIEKFNKWSEKHIKGTDFPYYY